LARQAKGTRGRGRLVVTLIDEKGANLEGATAVLALASAPEFARQFRAEAETGRPLRLDLPPGWYSIQGFGAGRVGRGVVEIASKQTTELRLQTETVPASERTRAHRLKPYGLDGRVEPRELVIERGDTTTLDFKRFHDRRSFVVLEPKSVDDLKRWVGAPDAAFLDDFARYGPPPTMRELSKPSSSLDPADHAAWRAIAREYIHGNSSVVSQHKDVLDRQLAGFASQVAVFFFSVVTTNAGATLTIGQNSNVFTCDGAAHPSSGHLGGRRRGQG
jgi:hypothetical protein